jgi:hypothetical protein
MPFLENYIHCAIDNVSLQMKYWTRELWYQENVVVAASYSLLYPK